MKLDLTGLAAPEELLSRADAIAELARYGLLPISGGSGEGGEGGDGGGAGAGDGAGGEGGETDLAKALDTLRKVREERDAAVKDRDTTRTELEKLQGAGKSDLDKANDRAAKAEDQVKALAAKLLDQATQTALLTAATKAGAIRPDAVYRLVKDQAQHDDTGAMTNADALVQAAKKETPELFRTQQGGGGNGGARDQGGSDPNLAMNTMIRQAAGRSS